MRVGISLCSPVYLLLLHLMCMRVFSLLLCKTETSSVSPGSYCDNCTGSTGGSECESSTSLGVIDSSNVIHRHPLHTSGVSGGGGGGSSGVIFHSSNGVEQILSNHQASPGVASGPVSTGSLGTVSSASSTLDAASVAHLVLANALDTSVNASPVDPSGNHMSNEASVDVTCTPLTDCSSSCDQINTCTHLHSSPSHLSNIIVTSCGKSGPKVSVTVDTSPVSIIRSSGAARKSSKVAFIEPTNGS